MATAAEIADLITAGMAGPQGADDSGWHLGQILTWDSSTGLNSVKVNNAVLTNIKALTPSIGTEYVPGQSVLIVRKQTQYFILGPVQVPGNLGSTPPTQKDGAGGNFSGTAGTWRDLDGGASVSPSFDVKLAPLQRVLFMFGASDVRMWGSSVECSLVVTSPGGLNQMATPAFFLGQKWATGNQISVSNNLRTAPMKTYFAQAFRANSVPSQSPIMPGINTVSLKYRFTVEGGAGTGTATSVVANPWILAIPF